VEQVLFRLEESSQEETLQRILVELATPTSVEGASLGYSTSVSPSLMGALSYLEEGVAARGGYPFARLYASFRDDGAFGLLAGEGSRQAFLAIRRKIALGQGEIPPPDSLPFGVIGMALPGWVLLFDEDLEGPVRDELGPDVSAAYLPLGAEDLAELGPERDDAEILGRLLRAALEGLPDREEP